MKEKINDWKPEASALINHLLAAGVEILHGNNGDEEFGWPKEDFIEQLVACDEAKLYVKINGKVRWLYLVLGNSPGEIASDYSCDPVLIDVVYAHYKEWELKGQPLCWSE